MPTSEEILCLAEPIRVLIVAQAYDDAWRLGEPLVPMLYLIEDARERFKIGLLLSAAAREMASARVAKSILSLVEDDAVTMDARSQAAWHLNMGNCLRDIGEYLGATACYQRAMSLSPGSTVAGAAIFQLARVTIERGGDLSEAWKYLDQAEALGYNDVLRDSRLLLVKARMDILEQSGRAVELLSMARECVRQRLPPDPCYHAEAGIHAMISSIASGADSRLGAEFHARVAVLAGWLGGRRREMGSLYSNMAKTLVQSGAAWEARFWLTRAVGQSDSTAESVTMPGLKLDLAWLSWYHGWPGYAIQLATDARQGSVNNGDQLHALLAGLQLYLSVAEVWPPQEVKQLRSEIENELARFPSNSLIRRRALQLMIPQLVRGAWGEIPQWPDVLRYSKVREPGRTPFLQMILDVHGEHDASSNGSLRPQQIMARGMRAAGLCGRGFLHLLRTMVGIPPRLAIAGALGADPKSAISARLALEWQIDPSGIAVEERRGTDVMNPSVAPLLAQLRATTFCLGANEAVDRSQVSNLYMRVRHEFMVTVRGPEAMSRPRNATADVPTMEEVWKKLLESPEFTLKVAGAMARGGKEGVQRYLMSPAGQAAVREAMQGLPGLRDTELGVHIDNFIITDLLDPLRSRFAKGSFPILVDLVQGEDRAWWILTDLSRGVVEGAVRIVPVDCGRKAAEDIVTDVLALIHEQESRGGGFSKERLAAERRRIADLVRGVLGPLCSVSMRDAELRLSLDTPWDAIPLEALPLDFGGQSLIEQRPVIRRDSSGRWLGDGGAGGELSGALGVCVGVSDEHNPNSAHEASVIAAECGCDALIDEAATPSEVLRRIVGAELIHVACHGRITLGGLVGLDLWGGRITGLELSCLDLSRCRLAVLNLCYSHAGERVGLAPVETLALQLLSAGVTTVLATTGVVDDKRASAYMIEFFRLVRAGLSCEQAVRAMQQQARSSGVDVVAFPYVLIGRGGVLFNRGDS